MDGQNGHNNHHVTHGELHVEGLNEDCPGNIPLATSRAQSTYFQHAAIDLDGLSWPSKYHICMECSMANEYQARAHARGKKRPSRRRRSS
jgi:hypothetical protein